MRIAAFNSFPFHYELFGHLIYYCKVRNHDLTIFCDPYNDKHGTIMFYNELFPDYRVNYQYYTNFFVMAKIYDIIFLITDDDPAFKYNAPNVICFDLYVGIRRPDIITHIASRPFHTMYERQWALPCYPIPRDSDLNVELDLSTTDDIHIAVVGGRGHDVRIFNRLTSDKIINVHIVSRDAYKITGLHDRIKLTVYNDMDTNDLIKLVCNCHYSLVGTAEARDHDTSSMSGQVPLMFALGIPMIINKEANKYYNFSNVIEYTLVADEPIQLRPINVQLILKERDGIIAHTHDVYDKVFKNLVTASDT